MIACDDPELFDWLLNASGNGEMPGGGSFVRAIAEAGLKADAVNYVLLRPLLLRMKAKYPDYNPR